MKFRPFICMLSLVVLLSACARKGPAPAADGPHATVVMRDGSTIAGTVTESSSTEIKLAGDDGIARTIPMAQVRAVDYGDTPAVATATPPGNAAPLRANPEGSAAPGSAVQRSLTARPPAPATAVTMRSYDVPAGTEISVRTDETIDSGKAAEGQTFAAGVTNDVRDETGAVAIPRGANAQIVIRSASKGGKIRGVSDLVLDLASVSVDGRRYQLSTVNLVERGKDGPGLNRRTAEYAGGAAAVGAVIGAIAGGGKGAAIGAGAGAGAGTLGQILTKGGAIKVPAESVLTFKLDRPLSVRAQ